MSLGAVVDARDPLGCHLGGTTVFDNLWQTGTVARRKLRERLRSKMKVRVVSEGKSLVSLALAHF